MAVTNNTAAMVDIICIADIQLTILYSIIITVLFYEILYQAEWEALPTILFGTERANIVSDPFHDRPNYRIYGFGFKKKKEGLCSSYIYCHWRL